jgi:hypothetical protein
VFKTSLNFGRHHQKYKSSSPCVPSDALVMGNKGNIVLYMDKELLGKNLLARVNVDFRWFFET